MRLAAALEKRGLRRGVGLPLDDEGDMADEAFVENAVDRGAIEDAALRHPLEPCAIGGAEDGRRAAGHLESLPVAGW